MIITRLKVTEVVETPNNSQSNTQFQFFFFSDSTLSEQPNRNRKFSQLMIGVYNLPVVIEAGSVRWSSMRRTEQ